MIKKINIKHKIAIVAATAMLALQGMVAFASPQTMPDGTVFDPEYYAQQNPDVVAAVGTEPQALYQHYLENGMAEGRAPVAPAESGNGSGSGSESGFDDASGAGSGLGDGLGLGGAAGDFDAAFYAQQYPDVVAAVGSDPAALYQHYMLFGKAEGRLGNASMSATPDASNYGRQVLAIVNANRASQGLSALEWSDSLAAAANVRAKEIASKFEHTRPNGTSCFTILKESGISYRTAGENIAAGQGTPEQVMNSWMNSSGHRANILKANYGKLGVGYYHTEDGYGSYWVQLFTN